MRTTGAAGRSSGERVNMAPAAPLLASGMTQPYYGAGSQVKQTAVLEETPYPAIALWRTAGGALSGCFPERLPFPGALVISNRARRATLVVLLPLLALAAWVGRKRANSEPS